jgi:hypothetical protein
LSVFLDLGDQGITMLNHISVLLVLVVGSIRLDNAVHTIDGAGNAVVGNELGKITVILLASGPI